MFKQFEDYLATNSKIATTYIEELDDTLKEIQNSYKFNQFYNKIPFLGSEELSKVRKEILEEIDNTPLTVLERREKVSLMNKEWEEVRSIIRNDYEQAQEILIDKYFKKFLYKDLTPDILKVADIIFAKAWDEGAEGEEEGGLEEVEECFTELVKFASAILTKSKEN
jgi:hypothetical protein